jgi:prolyl oligopeptidase
MNKLLLSTLLSASVACTTAMAQQKPITYPQTQKVDHTDDYFGSRVADPYRWLENDTAANTKAWVEAQNKVTFAHLNTIPFRKDVRKRLEELWNYPKYSAPSKEGDYYFFTKNTGLQNQSLFYYQKGLNAQPEVFLDPNRLSADGTVAVTSFSVSKDHRYVAYGTAASGSDWNQIQVMEIATKKVLSDKIDWVKFSGAAWRQDGFYYSRYDEPAKGTELSRQNEYQKIYFHKLGTPQAQDQLVYEDKTNPLRYYGAGVTEDGRFLILNIAQGTSGAEILVRDLAASQKDFTLLAKGFDHEYSVVDNVGDKLLMVTNYEAPNYRLVLVDPKNPDPKGWKNVIAEKPELLESVGTAGGKMFARYLKDASTRVYQYTYDGKMEREIKLPGIGTAAGFDGYKQNKELFYTFTSFTTPATVYRYDIASGTSEVFRKPEVKFNTEGYETKQVFFTSKDGTKVPMFIVHKKGLKLDGTNPTYLYAYGGFNINMTPGFSVARMAWLEQGGIFAMPNLRGGGEYGENWHKGGMLEKKQNVFDDFIGAAEYLISNKYTSTNRLAVAGGSNGGLLVGAVMTQRPDLFAVAFPAVGVLDMLRYHKFTVGWGWAVEYGSSDKEDQFKYLIKYSPLHNLKEGVQYPATLITTADHDDRVVPAHSFKFAAALQEMHRGNNPVLIRIETKAGHGAGKPTSKQIEEVADIYSFAWQSMGFTPVYGDGKAIQAGANKAQTGK